MIFRNCSTEARVEPTNLHYNLSHKRFIHKDHKEHIERILKNFEIFAFLVVHNHKLKVFEMSSNRV